MLHQIKLNDAASNICETMVGHFLRFIGHVYETVAQIIIQWLENCL
jgi:hypothetical protein